jgi:tripartite-type tricarboxylate transporter receptor subunit TctC
LFPSHRGWHGYSGRHLARKLSEQFGQQVVIDNRPGAGTVIGSDLMANRRRTVAEHAINALAANQSCTQAAV